jgi:hypothetical protein
MQAFAGSEGFWGIWSETAGNIMLEFAGTTRCEIRAKGVLQRSQGAAWLLVVIYQGAKEKGNVGPRVVSVPASGKIRTDFTNGVDTRKSIAVLWVFKKTAINGCLN